MERLFALPIKSTGHPLRRRIPRSALTPRTGQPMGDLQLFAMTFAAGFLAFLGFLS